MLKNFRHLALSTFVSTVVLSAGGAQAGDTLFSGFYVKGEAGISIGGSTGTTAPESNGMPAIFDSTDLGTGAGFGVGLGAYVTGRFRTELLFTSRQGHDYNSEIPGAPIQVTAEADVASYALMLGGIFDIHTFEIGQIKVTPNVSAMAGFAYNTTSDLTYTVAGLGNIVVDGGNTTNFAWGVGAGAGIALTDRISLDLGYRYSDLGDFETGRNIVSATVPAAFSLDKGWDGHYATHDILLGLRYKF